LVEDNNHTLDQADQVETADEVDVAEALRAEVAALKEQALRYAAEAENTRRRAEREANDARAYAIQKFARDLLEAADNLSRALQASPKDAADPAVKNLVLGIEMTEKALQTAFERNGLKKLEPAKGDKFDPHKHQAMMEQPSEGVQPGSVFMVMQPGYELFGRIIRPAMVAVTPKAAPAAAPSAEGYGQAAAPEPTVETKA
jgi:molecular chaperone GrpE